MVSGDELDTSADAGILAIMKNATVFVVYSDGDSATKKVSNVVTMLDRCTADVCALCGGKDAAKDESAMELIVCDLCNRSWHHQCLSEANQKAFSDGALLLCEECNKSTFICSMRTSPEV